jgi:hypothetical protein
LIVIRYNKENKNDIFSNVKKEVFDFIKKIKLEIQESKTDIFDFN